MTTIVKTIAFFMLSFIVAALFLTFVIIAGNEATFGALVLFATPTVSFLNWNVPGDFWYWLAPEGGGPATVLILIISAWVQLTILFAVLGYFIMLWRSNFTFKRDTA
jgi:hypothetical protein